MRKFIPILAILLISVLSLHITTQAHAHPIDNSDTYIYMDQEVDNTVITENELSIYVYLNWFQAGILVEDKLGITAEDLYELLDYQDLYDEYSVSNISITNNGELCEGSILESPISNEQLSLSLGARSILKYRCNEDIEDVIIDNTLFLEYFELPSNYTSIFKGEVLLQKSTLGRDNKILEFNKIELLENPVGDTSVDYTEGLSAEEINMLDSSFQEEKVTENKPITRSTLQSITDALFLRTENIKDQSLLITLFVVFLLGLLHTLEAGHSKVILASVMINNKMSFKGGVLYATIFTATHLADIVILGIIFFVADQFFNIYSKFTLLENLAAYMLLGLSSYILIRSIRNYYKSRGEKKKTHHSHALINEPEFVSNEIHDHTHDHNHNDDHHHHEYDPKKGIKEQISMAVLTGLAPCLFGWSIFMIILSSKQIWIIFPMILAFGLGIFLALLVVVFIVDKLRKPAYRKFDKISNISPIISGILLVCYSILIIVNL